MKNSLFIIPIILLGLALAWNDPAPIDGEQLPDAWREIMATTLCRSPSPNNLVAQGNTWTLTCGQRTETYQVAYRPVIVSMTASGHGAESLPLLLLPITMVAVPGWLLWRNRQQPLQKNRSSMPGKTSDKSTRLAIEALQKERQRIAFDANLFDLRLACTPYAKRCSERRKEVDAAIADLTEQNRAPVIEQLEMFPQ